jgi:hypothetical protein
MDLLMSPLALITYGFKISSLSTWYFTAAGQFLNLIHSVGLLGQVISSMQGHYLIETQNKHRQTSVPRVGFEPTIPAF